MKRTAKGVAKKMVMQPEFRNRRENSKRGDYSRKGKKRFNTQQALTHV